uniref:Myelin-oligodendrocyte glycoprotein-like n=1 Tax=Labrus bergylta TaxID=56723 RepID=A0A3Q3E5R0_9LABR
MCLMPPAVPFGRHLFVRRLTFPSDLFPGQYRVSSSSQPITASPGDDVILRCHVKPEYNVRALTIEWSRSGTLDRPWEVEGEEEDYVHLYRNQKDNEDGKIRAYINRTDLLKDSLRHGNVSLKIKNVTVDDQGTYRCFIPKLSSRVWRGERSVCYAQSSRTKLWKDNRVIAGPDDSRTNRSDQCPK